MASETIEQLSSRQFCSECGRPFAADDLVRFGAAAVCADCKPNYVQRMREGVATSNSFVYAGFWRRFAAVFIDGILLSIVVFPLRWAIAMMGVTSRIGTGGVTFTNYSWLAFWSWGTAIAYLLEITYYVYFLSQKGATLGKMLMGVKVVTATGGPISVARAFARYFARYLSWLTLCIGFIMAAFDDQKRALHDHICNTRVILD